MRTRTYLDQMEPALQCPSEVDTFVRRVYVMYFVAFRLALNICSVKCILTTSFFQLQNDLENSVLQVEFCRRIEMLLFFGVKTRFIF